MSTYTNDEIRSLANDVVDLFVRTGQVKGKITEIVAASMDIAALVWWERQTEEIKKICSEHPVMSWLDDGFSYGMESASVDGMSKTWAGALIRQLYRAATQAGLKGKDKNNCFQSVSQAWRRKVEEVSAGVFSGGVNKEGEFSVRLTSVKLVSQKRYEDAEREFRKTPTTENWNHLQVMGQRWLDSMND